MTDTLKPLDLGRYEGHTPGPWKWDEDFCQVNAEEIDVASVTDLFGSFAEVDANGRLIADAPLLLAEVRRLRKLLARSVVEIHNRDEGCPSPPDDGLVDEILDALRVPRAGRSIR